ncbi:MAG TPA: type II secretion system protein GspC [Steroidobacteraceae bacterium]|nr:type II secretion system protein GspC [Steroidobacteraceae bacterium]
MMAATVTMLDTRTNEWLSLLKANGPKAVSLLLAALIAAQLAQIAIFAFVKPVKSPQPVPSASAPRPQHSALHIQNVISAHLFGVAAVNGGAQDPANAPQSSANLLLAGTIATQDPKRGVAIISDGGGPSKVYSVGDRVGGASLHSVYLDHVILDRSGALETLQLPRQLLAGNRGPAAAMRRPGADPRTVAAVDNIRHMVQQDPGILDQVMRTVASYDNAAGKLRGFRAYPGRNRQIFSKLGLKAGDLVTAINGTALDDPQRSQEVFNTIQTSDRVTVTVERGGQKQDISLNIAQVAADATKELESDANAAPAGASAPAAAAAPTEPAPPPPPPNNNNENSNQ